MHILIALTYYRPHYSGLTIYAERLARALTRRGHYVTILTSQYDPSLPRLENKDGVTIIRVPPMLRISKGLIMPAMPCLAWKLIKQADIVNLHLPQMDASYITWMARVLRKPVVLTYQCDLHLPAGLIHTIANHMSYLFTHIAALGSDTIVNTTKDYAEHSPFLSRYAKKVNIIQPPIEIESPSRDEIAKFLEKFHIHPGERIIGMAARLATEKGVEYLVQALPLVLKQIPEARVLFVGPNQGVVGEERYAEQIMPLIQQLGQHWSFLGILSPTDFSAFFKVCDVLVLPSLNSTEAFGMVQVEAMLCGTPVVASDLPGVRQPILFTGMGKIVPVKNAGALGEAILDVLCNRKYYQIDSEKKLRHYSPANVAQEYESLFASLLQRGKR